MTYILLIAVTFHDKENEEIKHKYLYKHNLNKYDRSTQISYNPYLYTSHVALVGIYSHRT